MANNDMKLAHPEHHALYLPFKGGLLELSECKKTLFLNAQDTGWLWPDIECYQTFYPVYHELENKGHSVTASLPEGKKYDLILFLPDKHKIKTEALLAWALEHLNENGRLVCAAQNDLRARRFEKLLSKLSGGIESISKHKCRVFWTQKNNAIDQKMLQQFKEVFVQQKISDSDYISHPGIFGWNKIDRGSNLLLNKITDNISGTVYDLGCGYGYLGCELLKKHSDIVEMHMIEADKMAADCADENIKMLQQKLQHKADVFVQWRDVCDVEVAPHKADYIVMNPPFHDHKDTQIALGQGFIQSAATLLQKNGVLWMVANRQLPYENVISEQFASFEHVHEGRIDGGIFKVIRAVK